MDKETQPEPQMSPQQSLRIAVVRLTIVCLIYAGLLLGISNDWSWLWAWIYILQYYISSLVTQVLLGSELRSQRANALKKEDQPADKIIVMLAVLGQFGTLIIAGFDHRFAWSNWQINPIWQIIALILIEMGLAFGVWAMLVNKHFEATVRMQEDREHQVISSGPYKIVRHPGYAGFVLMAIFTPVVFNSLFAFIGSLLLIIGMVLRTRLEDKMLQQNLEGYREYTQQTRYRLIPGIW